MAHELTWEWSIGADGEGIPFNEITSAATQRSRFLWQLARFLTGADGATTQGLWTVAGSAINFDAAAIGWNGTTYVAVGNGFIATSTNGTSWTWRTIPNASHNYKDIAWSPSLGLWCAVGDDNSTGMICVTSSDAVTWNSQSITTTSGVPVSVAWSSTLNLFSVGASNITGASSPDGVTWTPRSQGGSGGTGTNSLIWTGSYFLKTTNAVGTSLRSSDGINFGSIATLGTGYWAASNLVDTTVAVGSSVCSTSDLTCATWTARTIPAGAYVCVAHGNGVFVALGTNCGARSTDKGVTWNPISPPNGTWSRVTYDGTQFIASSNKALMTSTDGSSWTISAAFSGMDAVDRWTGLAASDVPLQLRWSGDSTVSSWIVLKAPTALHANCWLALNLTSTANSAAAYLTFAAPTGDGATGPTFGVNATHTFITGHASTMTNMTALGGKSTRGDFWFIVGRVGTNLPGFGMLVFRLGNALPSDTYDVSMLTAGSLSATTQVEPFLLSLTSDTAALSYRRAGAVNLLGTASTTISVPTLVAQVGANAFTNQLTTSMLAPIPAYPMMVVDDGEGTSKPYWRGIAQDIKVGQSSSLALAPSVGNVEFMNVGSLWLPWPNGKTPVI